MTWVDAVAQLYRRIDLRLEAHRGSARCTENEAALRKALQDMADQRARALSEAALFEPARKVLGSIDRHWAGCWCSLINRRCRGTTTSPSGLIARP